MQNPIDNFWSIVDFDQISKLSLEVTGGPASVFPQGPQLEIFLPTALWITLAPQIWSKIKLLFYV